jgi:hypothetical protein
MFSKTKILLKEKTLLTFQKGPTPYGESEENQKTNEQAIDKNPNHSFNGNKNNKPTKLVFSIA